MVLGIQATSIRFAAERKLVITDEILQGASKVANQTL